MSESSGTTGLGSLFSCEVFTASGASPVETLPPDPEPEDSEGENRTIATNKGSQ